MTERIQITNDDGQFIHAEYRRAKRIASIIKTRLPKYIKDHKAETSLPVFKNAISLLEHYQREAEVLSKLFNYTHHETKDRDDDWF